MKTIILPGGSIKNKVWAEETAREMGLYDFKIIEWDTWQSSEPTSLDFQKESEKLIQAIGNDKVNVLAKSVGSIIFARNINTIAALLNKVVLCGLPLDGEGFTEENFSWYANLKSLPSNNILVFQNSNDPLGPFSKIETFVHAFNPEIKVVSKERSDHSYPYPEDFKNFLA